MSNIYIQEPPTQGKVSLSTSVGDIEVELWSREAPKACRNFVQLCLENYYNQTPFHRVVKDFIVQGGDPTGTGQGGESIYGHPFKDEFHTRLRFVRRGLVGMANAGKNDNGSQFFFTMAPAPELSNKHTIFGKVVGDTIYNMLKLQEGVVHDDKPEYPQKILKTKVLNNPFVDIKPRKMIEMIRDDDKKGKQPKSKMKATKDYKLLSFGEEAEEEEEDLDQVNKVYTSKSKGGKSSHDLLKDPKLSSKVGMEVSRSRESEDSDSERSDEEGRSSMPPPKTKAEDAMDVDSVRKKLAGKAGAKKSDTVPKHAKHAAAISDEEEDEELKEQLKKRDEIKKQIKALKKEMKNEKKGSGKSGADKDSDDEDVEAERKEEKKKEKGKNNDLLRSFYADKQRYALTSKPLKKGSAREEATLKMLAKFKSKLHSVKMDDGDDGGGDKKNDGDGGGNDEDDDDEDEETDVKGRWMANKLKFESDDPILAKDANTKDDDWFDIYDPRNPVNKRRRGEERGGSGKRRGSEGGSSKRSRR